MAKTIKKHGASVLILGLLIVGVIGYLESLPGQAADTLLESDLLSDSRPTTTANHTIYFKVQTAPTSTASTIILDFDNSFLFTSVTTSDIDLSTTTATSNCAAATYGDYPVFETPTATRWGWSTSANSIMTFTPHTNIDNGSMATNTCVRVRIGTNATSTAGYVGASGAVNKIVNGWPGVKAIDISGGFGQTGKMQVAIIEGVTVTATVSESLTATVHASTTCVLLTGSTGTGSSTTTTIPFAITTSEDFYDACQELEIATNAASGYSATLHKTDSLTIVGGTTIIANGNCDGACTTSTAAVWQTDTNNGFGYCMKDRTLNGAQVADASWGTNPCGSTAANQFFKVIGTSSTDAVTVMKSNTPTSTNYSYIGYRLSVDGSQAAGTYNTTLVYIVTPTY